MREDHPTQEQPMRRQRPLRRRGTLIAALLAMTLATLPMFVPGAAAAPWDNGRLQVSANQRFLQHSNGTPFFYLGDTAWGLFHRVTREEAEEILEDRRQKGFTVIECVTLGEYDGLLPNKYGDTPLINNDPTRPNTTAGNNYANAAEYDYWDNVDWIISKAAEKGLYLAVRPSWGDKIGRDGLINEGNARSFAGWWANRVKNHPNLIIVNGGDRPGGQFGGGDGSETPTYRTLAAEYRAIMPDKLLTFHSYGQSSSSQWFHNDSWLDYNAIQTGHFRQDDAASYTMIEADYNKTPTKPVFDIESRYEGHDINWANAPDGRFDDFDIRQAAHWSVFSGAFGHTYGSQGVWGTAQGEFRAGLARPGSSQVRHLKNLILSRPFFSRVPDQTLIAAGQQSGGAHVRATRGDGYALLYMPHGTDVTVQLGKISGTSVKAWWYNPRTGESSVISTFANSGTRLFDTPGTSGRGNDWVLVLDDAARAFTTPGGGTVQPSPTPSPTPPPAGSGTGLRGEYFNNLTLTAPAALTRTDAQVNFDWAGSPGSPIGVDNFSVRWTGRVQAPVTGSYTFATTSDDGIRLWVNGQPLVNNWTDHGPTTDTAAPIALTAGQQYNVTLEFYERGGGAQAKLLWAYPGQAQQAIPQSQVYPASGPNPTPVPTPIPTPVPTSPPGGTLTLTPTDDRDTQSDNAAGTSPQIAASQWSHLYARFNLGSISGPVTSARFRLHKNDPSSALGMTVHQASSDSWSQAGPTPALGSSIQSLTAPNATGYVEFDVTAVVAAQVAGDKLVSFGVTTNSGSWTGFSSKEGANAPQLVVTFGP